MKTMFKNRTISVSRVKSLIYVCLITLLISLFVVISGELSLEEFIQNLLSRNTI